MSHRQHMLQCVAVRCSALQCVAVCCSALQCVAVHFAACYCLSEESSTFDSCIGFKELVVQH